MLSFARFILTAGLVVAALGSAQADSGPKDLWSLYLREHSASLCGRGLSEEEETERSSAPLSPRERSRTFGPRHSLQQRRRAAARAAQPRRQRPMDARTLAQAGTVSHPSGALWYPKWYPGLRVTCPAGNRV